MNYSSHFNVKPERSAIRKPINTESCDHVVGINDPGTGPILIKVSEILKFIEMTAEGCDNCAGNYLLTFLGDEERSSTCPLCTQIVNWEPIEADLKVLREKLNLKKDE